MRAQTASASMSVWRRATCPSRSRARRRRPGRTPSDAARVDDQPAVNEPDQRHVGVAADDACAPPRPARRALRPAFVVRSTSTTSSSSLGVPWQNTVGPKPSRSRVTGCGSPRAVRAGPAAGRRPPRPTRGCGDAAPRAISTRSRSRCRAPARPLPQADQRVERLSGHRARSGSSVTTTSVGGTHVGLGQDRLEHREHAVDVRQHGHRSDHGPLSLPRLEDSDRGAGIRGLIGA